MQLWLNFWIIFFWLSFISFIVNLSNFLNLLFFSELTWLILYNISVVGGAINDDLNIVSFTFFILGLAGLEFSFGFLLILLFKTFNISLNLIENETKSYNNLYTKNNNIYVEKFFWNK